MKFPNGKAAPGANLALRCLAAVSAFAVLGFAAPVVSERMQTQQNNAHWRDRAEAFANTFAADAEGGESLVLSGSGDARLWRMAGAYGPAGDLDAVARDRDAIGVYQTFATAHFDQAQRQAQELRCLAESIYYEARSESRQGQIAVAEVVLNRVRHSAYPNTICGVVYQGVNDGQNKGCQFSFACDGSMDRVPRGRAWDNAERIAAHAMLGFDTGPSIGNATHYHTVSVSPDWSGSLVRTGQVGSHIFYRFRGRNDGPAMPVTNASVSGSDLALSAITSGVAPGAAAPADIAPDTVAAGNATPGAVASGIGAAVTPAPAAGDTPA